MVKVSVGRNVKGHAASISNPGKIAFGSFDRDPPYKRNDFVSTVPMKYVRERATNEIEREREIQLFFPDSEVRTFKRRHDLSFGMGS